MSQSLSTTIIARSLPRTSVVGAVAAVAATAVSVSAFTTVNPVGGDNRDKSKVSKGVTNRLYAHLEGSRSPMTTLAAPASISSPASSSSSSSLQSFKEGCRTSFKETVHRMYPSETELRASDKPGTTAVHVTSRDGKSQVVHLISTAFAGNTKQDPAPIFAWALPAFVDPTFRPNDPRMFDTPDWYKIVGLMMKLVVSDSAAKDGVVIAIPNDNDDNKQLSAEKNNSKKKQKDDFKAAVLIELYDPSPTGGYQKTRENLAAIKTLVGSFIRGNMPSSFYKIQPLVDFLTVFEREDEKMKDIHRKVGPSTSHIYVHVVAVNPTVQGQGLGKHIMSEISHVADELQLPCYLECGGSRNRAVYEKSGYHVVGTIQWAAKDVYGPTRTEQENIEDMTVYLMVRDPKSPHTPQ